MALTAMDFQVAVALLREGLQQAHTVDPVARADWEDRTAAYLERIRVDTPAPATPPREFHYILRADACEDEYPEDHHPNAGIPG